MKCALVLSGGGAKGAYQIGVWKAIRKLSIPIDIVTGTSVGALNGTMIVQGSYFSSIRLWKKMSFRLVFQDQVIQKYNNCSTTKDMLGMFSSNFFKQGGMDISKLEEVVKHYFNLKKFRRSKIDFGISTYNFTDLKPVKITKKELLDKNIVDYIIASSCCFPAFQMKKIGSKKFIDGGFFDYLPLNLALDLGAEEIIAVDLHAPGIREKVPKTDVPITYIEPHNDIGGFLNFNKNNAKRAMRYGYLDAMKAFHKFDGNRYTFKKNTLKYCQEKYNMEVVSTLNFIFDFQENKTTFEELLTLATYKRMISMKRNNTQVLFLDILENLAQTFRCSDLQVYSIHAFHKRIFKELVHTPILSEENVRAAIREKKVLSYLSRRAIIRYFYIQIEVCHRNFARKKTICKLALLFPKEFLDALYLYVVRQKKGLLW